MNNQAVNHYMQGKYGQAEALQSQGLEIKRRVLGPEHPDTLTSMKNLANNAVGFYGPLSWQSRLSWPSFLGAGRDVERHVKPIPEVGLVIAARQDAVRQSSCGVQAIAATKGVHEQRPEGHAPKAPALGFHEC
jgi:hypothetical protein